jgi:hypothetical protein
MLAAIPARAALRLPNLQDLQPLLAIILAIAQGIRRLLGLVPQIPPLRQVRVPGRRRPEAPILDLVARVREDLGMSFQGNLFLIVDHALDENLARQGKIIIQTLRQLIPEIFCFFFPPSRMATPLPSPTMNDTTEEKVLQALSSATWTTGRNVVVNVESNTISAFYLENQIEDTLEDIPLSILGIPIIPHLFPQPTPPLNAPPLLDAPDGLDPGHLCDGLSDQELSALRKYFPGLIQSIEFFLDRVVILTVGTDHFNMCFDKIGGTYFRAFGCVFVLLVRHARRKSPPEDLVSQSPPEDLVSPGGLRPGCKIYNEDGGFSTLGAFLVDGKETYPTSEYLLTWFTVSAHSFLRKRPFRVGSWFTIIFVPLIGKIALKWAMTSFFGLSVCRQYLLARVCIRSWELVWKFCGFKLGWHGLVCANSPPLTF